MSNPNPIRAESFDYIMYVDASGDDGFKFKDDNSGSSLCYCVSCLLVKKEDIQWNNSVLKRLKDIITKPSEDKEIKYTTIRRHKRSNEIYHGLSDLKGTIYTMVAFKKVITDPDCIDTTAKFLPAFCHYFPINIAGKEFAGKNKGSLLIVIDRMKHSEMDNVKGFMDVCFCKDDDGNPEFNDYTLIFRDSKDINFLGLQIVDWIAGMFRSFSESLYLDKALWRSCPICLKQKKRLCEYYRKRRLPEYCIPIKPIKKLMSSSISGGPYLESYVIFPIEYSEHGYLIDCLKF